MPSDRCNVVRVVAMSGRSGLLSRMTIAVAFVVGAAQLCVAAHPVGALRGLGTQRGARAAVRPAIRSGPIASFVAGWAGSFQIVVTGQPRPRVVVDGSLPAGVTFDSHADRLVGTAKTKGSKLVTLSATGDGVRVTQHLTVLVQSPAPKVLRGEGIDHPHSLVAFKSHLWIANQGGDSVSELDARTGSLVRLITGRQYHFNYPAAIVGSGDDLWVANEGGNSVTEFSARTGAVVRVLSSRSFRFDGPDALAADRTDVFVGSDSGVQGGNVVTEVRTDGSLARVFSSPSFKFNDPTGLAVVGTHLWVGNVGDELLNSRSSVTEIDLSTGLLIRNLSSTQYQFNSPDAIVITGAHVWIANFEEDDNGPQRAVTEIDQANGALVRTMFPPNEFDQASALTSDGTNLWVADQYYNELAEIDLASGAIVRYLTSAAFHFLAPTGLTTDGVHVWAGNLNSVTQLQVG